MNPIVTAVLANPAIRETLFSLFTGAAMFLINDLIEENKEDEYNSDSISS